MHGYPYQDDILVSVTNRKVPVRISGRGMPLLLLHGYPLDGRMWDRVVPLLSTDHLCIVPDLRGFGRSEEEDKSFSIADLADDCHQLLNALQIRRQVVVCGLSMGGYVALQFANRYAASLACLVLTNTRANSDDHVIASNRRTMASIGLTNGVSKVVLPMLEKLFSRNTLANQPQVVELVRSMMLSTRASTIAWAQLAMAEREDLLSKLHGWNMPVVCVAGAEDSITPPDVMRQMASGFPNSAMHVVASSSHLTPIECPAEFAQIVRQATAVLE